MEGAILSSVMPGLIRHPASPRRRAERTLSSDGKESPTRRTSRDWIPAQGRDDGKLVECRATESLEGAILSSVMPDLIRHPVSPRLRADRIQLFLRSSLVSLPRDGHRVTGSRLKAGMTERWEGAA
jgi:hypothetical protein